MLAGKPGERDLLLISPIILYDHPEIAEQSEGALFDATEIDEILTLRVMTMTDEEKAQARATDPRAAAIIDQCDAMSPDAMARLHGTLRDPHPDRRGSRGRRLVGSVRGQRRRPGNRRGAGGRGADREGQPGAAATLEAAPTRTTCSSPAAPPG